MRGDTILLYDNIGILKQGSALLASIGSDLYSRPGFVHAKGSIGGHFRHCLDFYASLLDGLESGRIDYNQRSRDVQVEQDVACALRRVSDLVDRLDRLPAESLDAPLLVCAEGADSELLAWAASSVSRELQFLLSHSTHHYALIAILLKIQGVTTPEEFGVAPSTLAHWRQATECAR